MIALLALACSPTVPKATPPRMPAIEPSYVFGEKPDGGQIVVGVLLRWEEPRVIADALPPHVLQEFVRKEAALAAETEEVEEEEAEPIESFASVTQRYAAQARETAKALGIRVLLREITLPEIAQVPVVIAPGNREEAMLAAYRRQGGIVVVAPPLTHACRQAILHSPHIRRLAVDPTTIVEARRDDGSILVRFATEPAEARHVDQGGKVLWSSKGGASLRFRTPPDHLSLVTDRLVVRWSTDGLDLRRSWGLDELVGAIDREILSGSEAIIGGRVALRAIYRNSKTGLPVGGQREEIKLVSGDNTLAVTVATSDSDGILNASLPIPQSAEPGRMELDFGDARIPLAVRRDYRVSIVTDRALYRPTDTMHVRVLVRRSPSGRAAANTSVTLTHKSARGRKARRVVKTSAQGIASWTIPLLDADAGEHSIRVEVGAAKATATCHVEAFEKPLFTFALEPARLELRPGESAPVTVRARFFNGAPMAGAKIVVKGLRFVPTPASGQLDANGVFRFTVAAGPEPRSDLLLIKVRNADGRTEKQTIRIVAKTRAAKPLTIAPDGDLVVGVPCRFAIAGGEPGATITPRLVGTSQQREITLDAAGCGSVEFTPAQEGGVKVFVGRNLLVGSAHKRLIRPDRRVASVGETLGFSLRGHNGPICVDVLRGQELVDTRTVRIQDGTGRLELSLTDDLAGVLTFHAYSFKNNQRGCHVRVLVRRGNGLTVQARADRDTYRPGGSARVDVAVTNSDGIGVASALGYWAVDEAVLALRQWKSGHETVFATLPATASMSLASAAESGSEHRIRDALGGISNGRFNHGVRIRHRRLPLLIEKRDKFVRDIAEKCTRALMNAYFDIYETIPFAEIRLFGSYRQQIAWLVENRYLKRDLLIDPWGSPIVLSEYASRGYFVWNSNGPDLQSGTGDDYRFSDGSWFFWEGMPPRIHRFYDLVEATLPAGHPMTIGRFWGPSSNCAIGIAGGFGGGRRGRGGRRNLRGGGGGIGYAPAPTRRDFPPTLVFVPEVLTDADGRATLTIPLADSITTWRMRLVASAAAGGAGVQETTLRVSQPLHLDPWLAPHLTDGDTLDLPVSVRNETDAAMRALVRLDVTHQLRVVGESQAEVDVGPRETGAHTFRIRAVKPGRATVRIETSAGNERDAVARIVTIRRDAREVVRTSSARISAGSAWLPKLGQPGPGTLRLDLYPSPIADTIAGIDGLIREPHG